METTTERMTLAELAEGLFADGLRLFSLEGGADRTREMQGEMDRFRRLAAEHGHSERNIDLASFGLCAYLDEKAEGRCRLAMGERYFRGPIRPAEFFARYAEADGDPELAQARQVMLICMVLGYQNENRAAPEEEAIVREAEAIFARGRAADA